MSYKRVLIATDLSTSETRTLMERARMLTPDGGEIHMAHVVEPVAPYVGEWMFDLSDVQDRLFSQARERLQAIGAEHGLDEANLHLLTGRADTAVPQCVKEFGVDILVAGVHPRSGLAMLLGSTSREMLKELTCDALLIRFPPE